MSPYRYDLPRLAKSDVVEYRPETGGRESKAEFPPRPGDDIYGRGKRRGRELRFVVLGSGDI
jgi:hypothetical protein